MMGCGMKAATALHGLNCTKASAVIPISPAIFRSSGFSDVPGLVKRNGRSTTIGMTKLFMRPPLTHLYKTQREKAVHHFERP